MSKVNIIVRDQTGGEVHFKVLTTTAFKNVFAAYCNQKRVDYETMKFLLDGMDLDPHHTPEGWEMVDGDVVDACVRQLGD